MPKIEISDVPARTGSSYPEPYASQMTGRSVQRLGDTGGLTQFGANLVTLQPGAKSSLRHWHETEDEFVMVTEGICTMVLNDGAHEMRPGECAAFPANLEDGHHFLNHTDHVARFLVVGSRHKEERATYPDDDMTVELKNGNARFARPDGSPVT